MTTPGTTTTTTDSPTLRLLQQLVRNACVNDGTPDSGHEARSVETLGDYMGRSGTVFEPHPGRQSVVYRIPGTDATAPTLTLMGHLDVVPANEEGWSVDPFGATIVDGRVFGRGTVDMLNLTASMAVVFKEILDGEVEPLPGDIVFLGVADEEAAGTLGAGALVDERWDLVATDYLLTEIAYPPLSTPDGPVYPVSVAEKGPYWSVLRSHGRPGHGSVPYGTDSAIAPLVGALSGILEGSMPVSISEEWRRFVDGLGLGKEMRAGLLDPDAIDETIDRIAEDDPRFAAYVHACTHMTIIPTVIDAGVKANVVPDRGSAQVDIRALPGQDRSDVDAHLRKVMGGHADRISIEPTADAAATASDMSDPLWRAIETTIRASTGRPVVPTIMPASTDARFFRRRGVPSYGVGLLDDSVSFADFLTMFHGNDECISVGSLDRTTNFLRRLLEEWRTPR